MDKLIRQAFVILRGLWTQRWIGIAIAWLVGLLGILVVWRVPDQFEATARVYVDTETILRPLLTGLTVQPNTEQQMSMLSRTLLTRPNIEKLVERAELSPAVDGRAREALIDDLMGRLRFQGVPRENLFTLGYRDPDRARAKRIVDSLVAIFVESNKSAGLRGTDDARAFIEGQITYYEKKLEAAENRLKEFKVRHMGLTEGGQGYFARLDEVSGRLKEARLALREAENSRDALKRQIAVEDTAFYEAQAAIAENNARLEALKRNLDTLLQRFTEQHPDVAETKRVIAALEEKRRHDLGVLRTIAPAASVTPADGNRAQQDIKVALAREEANVASLRTRVAEYEARYAQLKESGRMLPEVEAELAQLNRDYEINKKNYDELAARRESAQISSKAEAAGVTEFRIVDPPRVSARPVAPNRLLLMPLLLLLALAAGFGASFVANKIRPTFIDGPSLREVTELPVLGVVSFHSSPETRKAGRRDLIGFLSALASLIAMFGSAIAFLLLVSARAV